MKKRVQFLVRFSYIVVLISFLSVGCSSNQTLALKNHKYSSQPSRIIWLQLPGFAEEHLAMLTFLDSLGGRQTSFGQFMCVGKGWSYDLFNLRVDAGKSFRAQMSGNKNSNLECGEHNKNLIWKVLAEQGFKSALFERGVNWRQSIFRKSYCPEDDLYKDATIFRMEEKVGSNPTFHAQEKQKYELNRVYFDKSCNSSGCHNSLFKNIESVYRTFIEENSKTLFVVRDHEYFNKLSGRKPLEAVESLIQVEKLIQFFLKETEKDNETTFIVSTGESMKLSFPTQGKRWKEFARSGKNLVYGPSSLMNNIFAIGSKAENFCGIYEESDVYRRLLKAF